jgi:ABC-type phosphate transport system substrate-binding protein
MISASDESSLGILPLPVKTSFDQYAFTWLLERQITLPMNAAKGMKSRDEFNKAVIGRSSSQVNAYWSKLVFTGKGSMPKELSSDAEIISTIAANQGAIGYIDSGSVTSDVKVIAKF